MSDVTPEMVRRWWKAEPGWGDGSKTAGGRALLAAFNWAAAPGRGGRLIPENPIHKMQLPSARSRSKAAYLTAEERLQILAAIRSEPVREIAVVLAATGTRPVNLRRATAANVAADGWALVFSPDNTVGTVHKTFSKTGEELVVPLTPTAREVVLRMAADRPTGLLFRTATGRPWLAAVLTNQFKKVSRRAGLGERVTPYCFRHTVATDILEAGGTMAEAAAVLNNSPEVMHRHYNHFNSRLDATRAILSRVRQ